MAYRLYLVESNGHFGAGGSFDAINDDEALAIAGIVSSSWADVFPECEVWQNSRRIASNRAQLPTDVSLRDVAERRQRSLLELDEAVIDCSRSLRESFLLLTATRLTLPDLRSRP